MEYFITHFVFVSSKWLLSLVSSCKLVINPSPSNVKENSNIYLLLISVRD